MGHRCVAVCRQWAVSSALTVPAGMRFWWCYHAGWDTMAGDVAYRAMLALGVDGVACGMWRAACRRLYAWLGLGVARRSKAACCIGIALPAALWSRRRREGSRSSACRAPHAAAASHGAAGMSAAVRSHVAHHTATWRVARHVPATWRDTLRGTGPHAACRAVWCARCVAAAALGCCVMRAVLPYARRADRQKGGPYRVCGDDRHARVQRFEERQRLRHAAREMQHANVARQEATLHPAAWRRGSDVPRPWRDRTCQGRRRRPV